MDHHHPSQIPSGPIKLAIVGGGIAGLCLALGILTHAPHIQFHIYEAAPGFAEIGAGLAFGKNALRALWSLDPRMKQAYERVRTKAHSSNDILDDGATANEEGEQPTEEGILPMKPYLKIVMGVDHRTRLDVKAGREICEVMCEGGMSSIHRARFLDVLVSMLPEQVRKNCVTFGAKLIDIVEMDGLSNHAGVQLMFEDGKTAFANAVIGCDGVRSRVRQVLLGSTSPTSHPVFSGKYAYRGLIPMERAMERLGGRSAHTSQHRVGYNGHVLTFPINNGKTMNVVAFRTKADGIWTAQEWIAAATREEMNHDFEGWGDDVRAIIDMMQRCDKWALFDHSPASTYHRRGKICLVGDAAHASTPHQGAGAGMAVEDAYVLAGLLSESRSVEDLEQVFAVYEGLRKARTQRLVRSSREQASIYDFEAAGMEDDIDHIAQVLPQRWDWIWQHDVRVELDAGRAEFRERQAEKHSGLPVE